LSVYKFLVGKILILLNLLS